MFNTPHIPPMIPVQPAYYPDGVGPSDTTDCVKAASLPPPPVARTPAESAQHPPAAGRAVSIKTEALVRAPALAAAGAPIWEHVINIPAVLSPTPVTEPTAAGRPDVIVIDRTMTSLRAGSWHDWEDTSACFREIGLTFPRLRRVLVPRDSALAHDIRAGLAYQHKKMAAGWTLAYPFYEGSHKADAHAVCSLIRLGFTHAHNTRQLAHHMAQVATEPDPRAGADGISLIERLSLLRDLFEARWQIGTGENASLMGPAYAPDTWLTGQNERGQTPLADQLLSSPLRPYDIEALLSEPLALTSDHELDLPPAPAMAGFPTPHEHTSRHGTPTIAADSIDSFTQTTGRWRAGTREHRSSSDTLFVESQLARNTPSENPPQTGTTTESPHKRRRAAASAALDAHHRLPAGDA